MAGKTFTLEVVTPERLVYSGEVTSLVAPGTEGYFGVLANHRPLLASLEPGLLQLTEALGNEIRIALRGGFFEVCRNHAIVLADGAEIASEIDVHRAEDALRRAKEMLTHPTAGIDLERARRAARRAEARLKAARGPRDVGRG